MSLSTQIIIKQMFLYFNCTYLKLQKLKLVLTLNPSKQVVFGKNNKKQNKMTLPPKYLQIKRFEYVQNFSFVAYFSYELERKKGEFAPLPSPPFAKAIENSQRKKHA